MVQGLQRAWRMATSPGPALFLFGAICLASLPGAFAERNPSSTNPLTAVLFSLLGASLSACTIKRARTLGRSVLIMHLGVIVVLAGAAATSFGFVATVNVYEGTATGTAHRWDLGQDAPLGVDLAVKKINREYHPVRVQVGVLRGGDKVGLHELRIGEGFQAGGYGVRFEDFDVPLENLILGITSGGRRVGRVETSGESALPAGFPFTFVLVAYTKPVLKRAWVDMALANGGITVAEGVSEVNSPFEWQGLTFHHMKIEHDEYGNPYAGLQITRDPGRPLVYAGFSLVCAGALLHLARRVHGRH